jgi:hypothetical protein
MDRLIALLSALVGLIALGGALLVHNSAVAVTERQAAEIAELRTSLTQLSKQAAVISPRPESAPTPPGDDGTAEALLALQSRIVTLEQTTQRQDTELAAARAAAALVPAPTTEIAAVSQPASSATPAAMSADGPTTDCIPLGTRFMAQAGDSFPICKTSVVVEVAGINEGSAVVTGAGPVAAGGFANLPVQGCTVMVFSADLTGFAEMRVSCV